MERFEIEKTEERRMKELNKDWTVRDDEKILKKLKCIRN